MSESGDKNDSGAEGGESKRLIGLIIIAVLVVGGYFLVTKLKDLGDTQDCVMQGRTNCAPITR